MFFWFLQTVCVCSHSLFFLGFSIEWLAVEDQRFASQCWTSSSCNDSGDCIIQVKKVRTALHEIVCRLIRMPRFHSNNHRLRALFWWANFLGATCTDKTTGALVFYVSEAIVIGRALESSVIIMPPSIPLTGCIATGVHARQQLPGWCVFQSALAT